METLQNFLASPLLWKWLMTLLISHLLPAASALHPYPLCTSLCSSLFFYHWHLWSGDVLIPFFGLILKARGGISKEGVCLLLLLVIPYSSFFSLQDGWCVLIKMSIVLILVKHACERWFKYVGWGAGNGRRDLVSIWWYYYFWPASWKSSVKTLALILKLLNLETNHTMGIGLQVFLIACSLLFLNAYFYFKNESTFFWL